MEEQEPTRHAPSIGRVFKKAFGDIYDHLGLVVVSSFVWLVASLLPITLGVEIYKRTASPLAIILGAAASFVVMVALTAGLFYQAHKIVYRDDPSFLNLLAGFRRLFAPSISLAVVDVVVTGVLVIDVGMFFGAFRVTRSFVHNPVFIGIGVLFLWATVLWLMTAMYHMPVLMASFYLPELEVRTVTVFSVLRRGALLALGGPFFTSVFLFVIIAVTILCVISRFGMAIFVVYPGIVAIVLTHAARALFIKYGVIEERPEVVEDKGWRL